MGNQVKTYLTADNIISALGFTTKENFEAIREYRSGIALHTDEHLSHLPIQAATVDTTRLNRYVQQYRLEEYTRLEQLFILSIRQTLAEANIDLSGPDCCIVFSTTKGNISLLSGRAEEESAETVSLWKTAERVAAYFQVGQNVKIISNACISGVSALIVAKRLIEKKAYRKIIVTGGDILSPFITSGFVSFKSVSPERCRPFDARRDGLNLGEGCGTLLLTTEEKPGSILLAGGGISNDANHISGPSRTGDGLYHAIRLAMNNAGIEASAVGLVNTHGTATVYNDEMESKAIHLAGLQNVPINSLKPYFGHTLGAAGVIETIICAHELKAGILLGTPGFEEPGTSLPLIVQSQHISQPLQICVKTASGFGGCNAAIVLARTPYTPARTENPAGTMISTVSTVILRNSTITVDGTLQFSSAEKTFATFIREAYKTTGESNMKFYKMDDLCKLGYIASHYLLKDKTYAPTEAGIILGNTNASLHTDIRHQQIIDRDGDAAASPAVFVYTLPNVVAGEICIRHKIQGENTFFIDKECNLDKLKEYARLVMQENQLKYAIAGWCEQIADTYEAVFELLENKK